MIQPIADRVLIEPLSQAEKTTGGIIIPDMAKKKQNMGIVRAVGQSKMYAEDVELLIGNTVLYEENAGIEVEQDGKVMRLLKKGNVIMKID